jgi:NitT/TauT family transport system substrate-binding protein
VCSIAERLRRFAAASWLGLAAIAGAVPARALEHATVALPAVSPLYVILDVADDLGLWEKYGVDLKTVDVPGVGAVNAVISGSVEFAASAASSPLRAAKNGQQLLVIATLADRLYVQIVMRRSIAEAASFDRSASLAERARLLRGRTIAVEAVGGSAHAYLRLIAAEGGLTEDDLHLAPMLQSNMEAAFETDAIDGFVAGPPYSVVPVQRGTGVVVASGPDGDPDNMVPFGYIVMMTRPPVCAARRALCLGVGQALKEAAAAVADHPGEAVASVRKRFPNLSDAILQATMAAAFRAIPRSPVTTASIFEHADLFNIEAGFTKPEEKRANYDDLFTNEFVK